MKREDIKQLALECGFKLKPQEEGEDDLHEYVYEFAERLLQIKRIERYRCVPLDPAEVQWAGLARDLMMWMDMCHGSDTRPTGKRLYSHLNMKYDTIPAWLYDLIPDIDHVPSKGARVSAIYRAMVEASDEYNPIHEADNEVMCWVNDNFPEITGDDPKEIVELLDDIDREVIISTRVARRFLREQYQLGERVDPKEHLVVSRQELENIADNQPVWPGDLVSHETAYGLQALGLVTRDEKGNFILSKEGEVWAKDHREPPAKSKGKKK